MRILLIALALLLCGLPGTGRAQPTGYNTGMPYGLIGAADLNRLESFARKQGVDLMGDTKRAYEKDADALARVFAFALTFKKLDRNARTYGQIVYSSFLNLTNTYGAERYARIVADQPPAVRQRIRDFIFFDVTQAPRPQRPSAEANARASAPLLFPADYVFGAGNPIFKQF